MQCLHIQGCRCNYLCVSVKVCLHCKVCAQWWRNVNVIICIISLCVFLLAPECVVLAVVYFIILHLWLWYCLSGFLLSLNLPFYVSLSLSLFFPFLSCPDSPPSLPPWGIGLSSLAGVINSSLLRAPWKANTALSTWESSHGSLNKAQSNAKTSVRGECYNDNNNNTNSAWHNCRHNLHRSERAAARVMEDANTQRAPSHVTMRNLCCSVINEVIHELDFFGIQPFVIPQDVMLAGWW